MIKNEVEEAREKKEQVQPYCPKKSPQKGRLNSNKQLGGSLIILGIFISGIVVIAAIDMIPPATNDQSLSVPFSEWSHTISFGEDGTVLLSMLETIDGGILVAGFYNGLFFRKFDTNGIVQWTRHLDGEEYHPGEENDFYYFNSQSVDFHMFETSNGGFLMSWGFSQSPTEYTTIIRVDQLGNFLWARLLADPGTNDILLTVDDGLLIIGGSASWWGGMITKPWRVTKLDQDGNVEWNNTDVSTNESLIAVLEAPDGGYLTLGQLEENRIVHKIDQNGNIEWNETYEGWVETEYDIHVNSPSFAPIHPVDDGYILHGHHSDQKTGISGRDIKLAKINLQGELVWSQILKLINFGLETVEFSFKTADDGLLMVINTRLPENSLIAKINKTGNIEWMIEGGSAKQYSSLISQVTPERYLISRNIDYITNELLVIDINSTVLWNQVIKNTKAEQFQSVIAASDGGVVLAGFINDGIRHEPWWVGFEGIWIIKINGSVMGSGARQAEWINTLHIETPITVFMSLGLWVNVVVLVYAVYVIHKLRHFWINNATNL